MSEIQLTDSCPGREAVFKHYGYSTESAAHYCGFWPNDGTALDRLGDLPEALRLCKAEKQKIRIVFDYDPEYPMALIQTWGMPQTTLPLGTGSPEGTQSK